METKNSKLKTQNSVSLFRRKASCGLDVAVLVVLFLAGRGWALEFPGPAPGDAQGKIDRGELVLENEVLSCTWSVSGGRLKPKSR